MASDAVEVLEAAASDPPATVTSDPDGALVTERERWTRHRSYPPWPAFVKPDCRERSNGQLLDLNRRTLLTGPTAQIANRTMTKLNEESLMAAARPAAQRGHAPLGRAQPGP
jgi:hypothetical protein